MLPGVAPSRYAHLPGLGQRLSHRNRIVSGRFGLHRPKQSENASGENNPKGRIFHGDTIVPYTFNTLYMNRLAVRLAHGFVHHLGKGRVRVDGGFDIFVRGFEGDGKA